MQEENDGERELIVLKKERKRIGGCGLEIDKGVLANIIIGGLTFVAIVLLIFLVLNVGFKPYEFDSWCSKYGGTRSEIANATCAAMYSYCTALCNFKCGTINYYDEWKVPECEVVR